MDGDRKPRDTIHKWKVARWWSLGGLGFIAGLSLIGLVIAWSGNPASTTLRYEFAKTCMAVLAVAFFGGLATIATFSFQHSRTQEDDQSRREAERNERKLEQCHGQDDQLRSIMEETLTAYNRVKRIRRLLKAETNNGVGLLTVAVYDKHMADLIDEQLTFERLKKLPPFIRDERVSLPPSHEAATSKRAMKEKTLQKTYEDIEEYLNDVIKEYEKKRYTVSLNDSVSLVGLDNLRGFIGHKLVTHVSDQMDEVIDILRDAIWLPLGQHMLANTSAPKDETQLALASHK